jgi:hypothetical protein
MANTYYTNIATNQQSGLNFPGGGLTTQPGQYNDPILELGNLDMVLATYTLTGTEAANDVINIVFLPAGCAIDTTHSNVVTNGSGTTATVTIGDLDTSATNTSIASATRYSTSLNVASSNTVGIIFTGGAAATVPYELTSDAWITATLATANTTTTGNLLVFRLAVVANR